MRPIRHLDRTKIWTNLTGFIVSAIPCVMHSCRLVGPLGLEPRTDRLWAGCSNQLSYRPQTKWSIPSGKHCFHQRSPKNFCASLSKKPAQCAGIKNDGAENEARTRDPHLGKVVLYHWATSAYVVLRDGIEPPTRGFSVPCSTDWATWAKMATSIGFEPTIFAVTGRHVNRYTTRPYIVRNR